MKVAAVDIGTNTVRLLLADAHDGPSRVTLDDATRHEVITKLGEGLDASGRLSPEPMERALVGLRHYASLIGAADVAAAGGVATAATRTAENGAEFAELVAATLGFAPRVIDGVEEARLTFLGATAGLGSEQAFCVIDVGGGSTEFVIGYDLPEYAVSIDIGSVRLTERRESLGFEDPLQLRAHVDSLFDDVVAPISPSTVLGSGGTFVTLAAVACDLPISAIESTHGLSLSFAELSGAVDRLLAMSVDEIAAHPAVVPARAGVLQAGAICAERAVAQIGASQVRISISDILDGVAMELGAKKWPGTDVPGHR